MNIFEFDSYIEYLKMVLTDGGRRSGSKAALAQHLRCQSTFVSQVLAGRSHLSLEHAILASDYFKHRDEEQAFFLLLVQCEKAGSVRLRNYFQKQIQDIRTKRTEISKRVSSRGLVKEFFVPTYYSMWWYAAVHVLTGLPDFQSVSAIARKLDLSLDIVEGILAELSSAGLVEKKSDRYEIGQKRIHLDQKASLIQRHHVNWRLKSIQQCEKATSDSLRYSSVLALSEQDAFRVKELILELVEKSEHILRQTDEEDVFVLLCDFFRL